MARQLSPLARLLVKATLIGVCTMTLCGIVWWWSAARTDYETGVGWTVDQPVPFSHQHHVGGLGLDCRFCHADVERSADAGMPPTHTCMTCHSQIWTNAALLAPIRESLADNRPIQWRRVNRLPDYVYFHHDIHIAKGIGCSECHGAVGGMNLMARERPFTMKFCLDCHRDPAPHLRPAEDLFDTEWRRDDATPKPEALFAFYHLGGRKLTDCSICHR